MLSTGGEGTMFSALAGVLVVLFFIMLPIWGVAKLLFNEPLK
jgi:hypothetical protein